MAEATYTKEHAGTYALRYVPVREIARIARAIRNPLTRTQVLANIFRINVLYMINRAGSGHIGTSMSAMDIMTHLWMSELRNPNSNAKTSDIFFSSKGHDAPGLYSVLIGLGKLPEKYIHTLRRLGGLPGHPDVTLTPYIATNTGSLGMGISKARGMARAYKEKKRTGRFYVLTGDGELQEGQIWESLQPTANHAYSNITVIVDHNKIQSDTYVKDTSDLGDLEAKFKAFGWRVFRIDGHDISAFVRALAAAKKEKRRPQVIIADTVKGKGTPTLESYDVAAKLYRYHSGALEIGVYAANAAHLVDTVEKQLKRAKVKGGLKLVSVIIPPAPATEAKQSLIKAYSETLVALGRTDKNFIAIDADLTVDLGLLPFKKMFPNRHIQAGIAEQDMVSFAGGMALQGVVPIVHSFACFMTPRANEQMYNNASEGTKIIYFGGLAGVVPGMPGHSHQSVRDIALMGSLPNVTVIEPADGEQIKQAITFALKKNKSSSYLRVVSVPYVVPFMTAKNSLSRIGVGSLIKEGTDLLIIAYGPVLLSEAYRASEALQKEGVSVAVLNMPWLNAVDEQWLKEIASRYADVLVLDNHVLEGGLGQRIAASLMKSACKTRFHWRGIEGIPAFGQNAEVLAHHGLDEKGINKLVCTIVS